MFHILNVREYVHRRYYSLSTFFSSLAFSHRHKHSDKKISLSFFPLPLPFSSCLLVMSCRGLYVLSPFPKVAKLFIYSVLRYVLFVQVFVCVLCRLRMQFNHPRASPPCLPFIVAFKSENIHFFMCHVCVSIFLRQGFTKTFDRTIWWNIWERGRLPREAHSQV